MDETNLEEMSVEEFRELEAEADRIEFSQAKENFAVYCGLHIPAEVEKDDMPRLHELSLPARYIPATHHQLICKLLQALEEGELHGRKFRNLIIQAPPGSAKALALDTPIPTPSGWRRMGDMQIGDCVFDEQGKVCRVTWVSPIFKDRPVYKVLTDCGDEIIADHDHEWRARLDRRHGAFRDHETHIIARRRNKRAMVEHAKALDLPDANLPIDPYLLGMWLGNGNSAGLRITCHQDDVSWVRDELGRLGYKTSDSSSPLNFGVLGVRHLFVQLGLVNDPAHKTYGKKYIPKIYMRGSIRQRLALVQGLIDSDGTVSNKQGSATFCNTNEWLALQFRELVRSLGVKAGWSVSKAMLYGVQHGMAYHVSFYMKEAARSPRKSANARDQYRTPNTYISAEPCGTADTICIEVDSPSHLYLCGESMTPTHNSTYCSHLFPSWYLGKHPAFNVIQGSQTDDLAHRFGRRARNTFASELHHKVFNVGVASDSRAAGSWETEKGGEYFATGVQPFAGRRAELLCIDDAIRGQEDADSQNVLDKIWNWYVHDAWPRLKPHGKQVIVSTRWSEGDIIGRIIPKTFAGKTGWVKGKDGEMWYVLCLKAVIETEEDAANDPLGRKVDEILWPEWFTREMMDTAKVKAGIRGWAGQYQQMPRPEGGAILLSNWWREWKQELPKVEYVIQVYDTAFEEGEENSYSARTTWGIFSHTDTLQKKDGLNVERTRYCCILLEAWRSKCEFTELRDEAKRGYKRYRPDRVLIEKRASGHSLLQELRRAGLPVRPANPKWMGRSKRARAYAAQTVLEDGCVFYPCKFREGTWTPYSWALPVVDEVAGYPDGEFTDYADTAIHAWLWLRQHWHLKLTDEDEDKPVEKRRIQMFG